MEWWGWVAWAFAMATGGYGAWRSWRTDRAAKLLGKTWEIAHFQNAAWILTNKNVKTATKVELEVPTGWFIVRITGSLDVVPPTGWVKLLLDRRMVAADETLVVTWTSSRWGRPKRLTQRLAIPPQSK